MSSIPLFVVRCLGANGETVRSEICVSIFEAEQRLQEFKEFDRYSKVIIVEPGDTDD